MSKILFVLGWMIMVSIVAAPSANAAMMRQGRSEYSSQGSSGGGRSAQNLSADLTLGYVRDTRSDGKSDSAARLSLGGMFSSWVGLDILGMFQVKSQNYLVGADIRVMPVDWLFFKGGYGAYSDKNTRNFRGTPLAGTGIIAHITESNYLISEFSFYQYMERNNVSFGLGVGIVF